MPYKTQGGAIIEITSRIASDGTHRELWKCPCGEGRWVRRGEAQYDANDHAKTCHWAGA